MPRLARTLAACLMLGAGGCYAFVEVEDLPGIYRSVERPTSTLELRKDGTFVLAQPEAWGGERVEGSWEILPKGCAFGTDSVALTPAGQEPSCDRSAQASERALGSVTLQHEGRTYERLEGVQAKRR